MPLRKSARDTRLQLQRPLEDEMKQTGIREESYSDFREVYALSKGDRSGSSCSLSSLTTNRSSATCPVANTTRAKEKKKHRKRIFRAFANWLMKFLEKRDPRVFGAAQEVIRDCEVRKKRGQAGYESVTDSLKEPLRRVVGNDYWREAQCSLDSVMSSQDNSLTHIQASSSESDSENMDYLPEFSWSDPAMQGPFIRQPLCRPPPPPHMEVSPFAMTSAWDRGEEKRIRRERFYMLLRVLMKYLETKDHALYLKAKAAINDCEERNANSEKGYESLSGSIKKAVKRVVGDTNWRRAESYLAKAILRQTVTDETEETRCRKQQQEEELILIRQPLPYEFHHEPYHPQETVQALGHKMAEEEQSDGEVQEFFVNVCQVFSSNAKRAMEEQTYMVSSATSNFCLRNGDEEIEAGSAYLERKRRRLQTAQCGPIHPRI